MRLRNNKNAKGILEESKYVVKEPEKIKVNGIKCLEMIILLK